MSNGAKFNGDRTRRRLLWRTWDIPASMVGYACFICLNPSTADEKRNDHSVTKMVGFSERLGCGGLLVVNLFDICTTYPKELYGRDIPALTSAANDAAILSSARQAKVVICAWGGHGVLHDRDITVMHMLKIHGIRNRLALKINDDGTPAHPLRLSYSLRPIQYRGRQHA